MNIDRITLLQQLEQGVRVYDLVDNKIGRTLSSHYRKVQQLLANGSAGGVNLNIDLKLVETIDENGNVVEIPSEVAEEVAEYFRSNKLFKYPYAANQLTINRSETYKEMYMTILNVDEQRANFLISMDRHDPEDSSNDVIYIMALSLNLNARERIILREWIKDHLYITEKMKNDITKDLLINRKEFNDPDHTYIPYVKRPEGEFSRSLIIYIGITPSLEFDEMKNHLDKFFNITPSLINRDDLMIVYPVEYATDYNTFVVPWFIYFRPIWTIPITEIENQGFSDPTDVKRLNNLLINSGLTINYQNAVYFDREGKIPPKQAYKVEIDSNKTIYHLAKDSKGQWISTTDQLLDALESVDRYQEEESLTKEMVKLTVVSTPPAKSVSDSITPLTQSSQDRPVVPTVSPIPSPSRVAPTTPLKFGSILPVSSGLVTSTPILKPTGTSTAIPLNLPNSSTGRTTGVVLPIGVLPASLPGSFQPQRVEQTNMVPSFNPLSGLNKPIPPPIMGPTNGYSGNTAVPIQLGNIGTTSPTRTTGGTAISLLPLPKAGSGNPPIQSIVPTQGTTRMGTISFGPIGAPSSGKVIPLILSPSRSPPKPIIPIRK